MRKVTALFLLMIMAVFAIRPVIAMHYCNGELYSFNLYQHQEDSSNFSCCHSDNSEASPISHQTLTSAWGSCCDNTALELATDEYRNKAGSFVLRILSNPVEDGIPLFANTNSLKPSVLDTGDPSSGQLFPPEGLFMKDIDILTYICIYRI